MSDQIVVEEKNLLDDSLRTVGLVLMSLGMALSLFLGLWVFCKRRSPIVRATQPTFLVMLCIGSIISLSIIVPLGANDENTANIDAACLSMPWLDGLGSTFIFAALFSKLWRVNKIFHAGGFQRKVVTVKEVLWPFFIILSLNLLFLVIMTAVDPPVWIRKPINSDVPEVTVGSCDFEGEVGSAMLALQGIVNIIAIILLCVQAYRARDIRSEFSEARGVALALFCMLQANIITYPTYLLLDEGDADARYMLLVLAGITSIFALLLFVFGPLISHQRKYQREGGRVGTIHVTGLDSRVGTTQSLGDEQHPTWSELREA